LFEAYNQEYGSQNITVVFNKNLKLDEDRRRYVNTILPDAQERFVDLPTVPGDIKAAKKVAAKKLNRVVEEYGGQKIDFLLLNLFTFDYCAAFPDDVNKLLLFYDLTPLQFWSDFSKQFGQHIYFAHFATIFEADRIFSISEATKNQLDNLLGINPAKITNIKGARIKRSHKDKKAGALVKSRFILAPTSDFAHKNNLNMVKAFARFNEVFGNCFQLVMTSDLSDNTRQLLSGFSENISFVGSVSDNDLAWLYDNAELILCPAITEGLGLPVLEAVHHSKPAVCSAIEAFQEISNSAFYFCDPLDVTSIEQALVSAIIKRDWASKLPEYGRIAEELTWQNSARIFGTNLGAGMADTRKTELPRLSVVAPVPCEIDSTLGQLVQGLYNPLSIDFLCDYYLSRASIEPSIKADFLTQLFETYYVTRFRKRQYAKSKAVLYFIDESKASVEVLRRCLVFPGVVVVNTNSLVILMGSIVSPRLQVSLFGKKPNNQDVIDLLRETGNQVVIYDRNQFGQGWKFAHHLTTIIKGK
jgi:glycosyltransferase involved in cell wall biosynthesis